MPVTAPAQEANGIGHDQADQLLAHHKIASFRMPFLSFLGSFIDGFVGFDQWNESLTTFSADHVGKYPHQLETLGKQTVTGIDFAFQFFGQRDYAFPCEFEQFRGGSSMLRPVSFCLVCIIVELGKLEVLVDAGQPVLERCGNAFVRAGHDHNPCSQDCAVYGFCRCHCVSDSCFFALRHGNWEQ